MRFRRVVRAVSLRLGIFRFVRLFDRHLRKSEIESYKADRDHYSHLLQDSGLCFDVGANAGRISEVLLELGHTVVAFEPQADCVRELKVRCAPHLERLSIEEAAVGAAPGKLTLHVRDMPGHSSLHADWMEESVDSVAVPVTTLDAAITKYGVPQYCKIDVEGWELEVFKGLTQPLPLVSFEFHKDGTNMEAAYACIDLLCSLGAYTLNFTPGEDSRFMLQEWTEPGEFKQIFARDYQTREDFYYGDVYAKRI